MTGEQLLVGKSKQSKERKPANSGEDSSAPITQSFLRLRFIFEQIRSEISIGFPGEEDICVTLLFLYFVCPFIVATATSQVMKDATHLEGIVKQKRIRKKREGREGKEREKGGAGNVKQT